MSTVWNVRVPGMGRPTPPSPRGPEATGAGANIERLRIGTAPVPRSRDYPEPIWERSPPSPRGRG
jgi:hypothetical protein